MAELHLSLASLNRLVDWHLPFLAAVTEVEAIAIKAGHLKQKIVVD